MHLVLLLEDFFGYFGISDYSEGTYGIFYTIRGGTKYLVDNNDCSFYAPELIFRDTPLIFCMNIPNNAR